MKRLPPVLLLTVCAALAGCAWTPPHAPPSAPRSAAQPAAPDADVAAEGVAEGVAEMVARYEIDPTQSELRVLVFRAGQLARLGHNHVVRAGRLAGEVVVAEPFQRSQLRLRLAVAELQVDEAALRAEEGAPFAAPLQAEFIAATRDNMLGEAVLDAAQHPWVEIESLALTGPQWAPDVSLRVTLRGVAHTLTVPVVVERDEARLVAGAVFELRHSELGLTPFSVLGGALQVADTMRVRLRLVALRR